MKVKVRRSIGTLCLLLLILLSGIYSCWGQSVQRITHAGIEGAMGLYGYALQQCQPDDVDMRALSRGAVVGVMFGNDLFKTRLRTARFYATPFVKKRFDLYQSELLMNFYPLEFLRTSKNILDISVTMGVSFNRFKFDKPYEYSNGTQNTSEEYGIDTRFVTLSQVMGMGIEYRLSNAPRIIHFFAEALFSSEFCSTGNVNINGIHHRSFASLNFGVRLGRIISRNTKARF